MGVQVSVMRINFQIMHVHRSQMPTFHAHVLWVFPLVILWLSYYTNTNIIVYNQALFLRFLLSISQLKHARCVSYTYARYKSSLIYHLS